VKNEDLDATGNRCLDCFRHLLAYVGAGFCEAKATGCRTEEGYTRGIIAYRHRSGNDRVCVRMVVCVSEGISQIGGISDCVNDRWTIVCGAGLVGSTTPGQAVAI
jgi:hypothetical protein